MLYFRLILAAIKRSIIVPLLILFIKLALPQSVHDPPHDTPLNKPPSAVMLLSEFVKIPSLTGSENKAAEFFRKECQSKGLYITTINDSIGSFNFAASLYPLTSGKPNIVFLTHSDVVAPGDSSGWKYPPFSGAITEGKVWGRGSFDNKGLGVVQLSAIEQFVDVAGYYSLPYNVTLLSVSGEEIGGSTGSALVAKEFKSVFNPVVVIGEGGSGMDNITFLPEGQRFFGISITEKTFVWLKLSCEFKTPGHSSIAGSESANTHLIKALSRLTHHKQKIHTTEESKLMFTELGIRTGGIIGYFIEHINWIGLKPVRNFFTRHNPQMNSVLCNTVTISSIGTANKDPNRNIQEATAILDCRLLPGTSPEKIIKEITRQINDTLIKVSVIRQGPPQYSSKPDVYYHILSVSLQKVYENAEIVPMLFPASSDNSYYRACGVPVYGLNPWIVSTEQLENIHNYNEYVDFEDIELGTLVYVEFLKTLLFSREFERIEPSLISP